MNTFKKKVLSFVMLAGLGFSFMPAVKAEKNKVSQMNAWQRSGIVTRAIVMPVIDTCTFHVLLKSFIQVMEGSKEAVITGGIAGTLLGLGMGLTASSNYLDTIEFDKNLSVIDCLGGFISATGLSCAFIALMPTIMRAIGSYCGI